jgi:hypothetical protein
MMENMNFGQMQFGKQMMDFYKSAFDNALNTMAMMQDQNENMVKMFLEQATWLPEEGKKPIMDWIDAVKKGREDFQKAATDNYKKVEEFFATATKTK